LALAVGLHATLLSLGLGGRDVGVLVAHLVPATGYTTLYFMGVFDALDPRLDRTARMLGAAPLQRLGWVTLPLVRRPLAEAFALGFLISWAQVPLTLLVGQGRVRTLTVEVLALVQAGQDPRAAAGALLLVLPPLAVLGVVALGVRAARVVVA
jgi:putative spermidine/putrescine transport system permease protein